MERRMLLEWTIGCLLISSSLTASDNQINRQSQRLAENDNQDGKRDDANNDFGTRSLPLRAAVESVPPKLLRSADSFERLPLRDAVERRPPAYDDDLYALTDELESLGIDPWAYTEQERKNVPERYQSAQEYPEVEHHYKIEQLQSARTKFDNKEKTVRTGLSMVDGKGFRGNQNRQTPLVVCFVEGWASFRMEPMAFNPTMLPADICTNVLYAFATLDPDTYKIVPQNEEYDIIKGGYKTVTGLKREQPKLKVSISIGGAGGARWLSAMAAAKETRKAFVENALQFVRMHNFDGIDLHWQYPGDEEAGGNIVDKENLSYLLKELKTAFAPYNLLVSMAVAANRYRVEDGYDVAAVSNLVDFVTLQAWDLHEDDELCDAADHHSPITSRPHDRHSHIFNNVEYATQYWLRRGMAKSKLVLGVPFFGRSYTLQAKNITAPGSPASDLGQQGKYTQTKGLLAYFEICMSLHQDNAKASHDAVGSPYAVFDDQWVGYDNVDSVKEKMLYVLEMGLAGAAAWTADMDDFRGVCGDRWPLLTTMSNTLKGKSADAVSGPVRPTGSCLPGEEILLSDPNNCASFYLCRGGFKYHLACEDGMVFDPSSGLCRLKESVQCMPGQSFKIYISASLEEINPGIKHPGDDLTSLFGTSSGSEEINSFIDHFVTGQNGAIKTSEPDMHGANTKNNPSDKLVVCYVTNWSFYRKGEGKFVPENIDPSLCTHVVYAYASLDPETLIAKEFDPWTDVDNQLYERITALKDVTVLLGLGGWTDSAGDKYSRLVSSGATRRTFVTQLVAFLRRYNFQGVQLDWNYPVCWQSDCNKGPASDKHNLVKLAQELSAEFKKQSPPMTLGLAISGYKEVIEVAYDLPMLSKAADFLSAMTYDYHGGWERSTAHGSPLFPQPGDDMPQYSVEFAIKYLIEKGADPSKLLLGLAFYGQSYRLQNSALRAPKPVRGTSTIGGPGSPAAGPGDAGESTKQPGMLSYGEICFRVKNLRWTNGQISGAGPFAYHRDQWVGYEDPESISDKQPLLLGHFSHFLRAANTALKRIPPTPSSGDQCKRPSSPVTPTPPVMTPPPELAIGGGNFVTPSSTTSPATTTISSWTTQSTKPTTPSTITWWSPTTTTTTKPTTPSTTMTWWSPSTETTPKPTTPSTTMTWWSPSTQTTPKPTTPPTTTTWWSPSTQTTPKPTTPSTTTTWWSTPKPPTTTPSSSSGWWTISTTTAKTTTKPQPTGIPTTSKPAGGGLPNKCEIGAFSAFPSDCGAFYQCIAGYQKKQSCAPGLHWSNEQQRCDWPSAAKCSEYPTEPTTTTLPLITLPDTTPMTTSTVYATYSPPTTMTVTSTRKWPTTTPAPATEPPREEHNHLDVDAGNSVKPGMPCQSGSYYSHPRCEMFFVCVNQRLVAQNCAPGLAWHEAHKICYHKAMVDCSARKLLIVGPGKITQKPTPLNNHCESGSYTAFDGDCQKYRHCLFGKYEIFDCGSGLHWNHRRKVCDWPSVAKCEFVSSSTEDTIEITVLPTAKPTLAPTLMPTHQPTLMPTLKPTLKPISTKRPETGQYYPEYHEPTTTTTEETFVEPVEPPSKYFKVVCYFTNWAWYRPGKGKFVPEDIDPGLCTHIVYGFAVLDSEKLVIRAHDSWADFDNRFYERVVAFKKRGLKVSLALGGWNDSAGDKYSRLVNNPSARARFINHALGLLDKYNFDGLDLDWEYPKCWQVNCKKGPDSDKAGFSALITELSEVFKPRGLLLSSAVSPNKIVVDAGYNVPILAKAFDWIAVMTYDYHGQWDKKTGHVAPLYYHEDDDNTYFNTNYTIHYWMELGAPASKLVLGMPMYGQSFTMGTQWDTPPELLLKKNGTGLNVPAKAGGQAGEYTRAKGFLAYYEICDRIQNHGWTVVRDPLGRMGPYAFKGDQWVSFDDAATIRRKSEFVRALKLGGAMIWALDLDDFRNSCGGGEYPLLNQIRTVLNPAPNPGDLQMLEEIFPKVKLPPQIKPEVKPETPNEIGSYPAVTVNTASDINKGETDSLAAVTNEYKIVCYFTNWAWYRPGLGKYLPSDIDTSLCTHIVYGFAVLDSQTLTIVPHDPWADIDNKFFQKVTELRSKGVKVSIAIGGWNDSLGDKYSRLVNNPSSRRTFVINILDFIAKYDFDGLDLDWEYPKCWQVDCNKGPDSDKEGFAALIKELHSAFRPHGYLLSSAVSPNKIVIDDGYDVSILSQQMDWIAVMAYDYHGQWDKKTGHVAPMYEHPSDTVKTFNANFTINYWISQGADPKKLIMGMPMYGQSFSLAEVKNNGLNAPTYGGGEGGEYTGARGFLSFYEICDRIKNRAWNVVRDPMMRMGPYATLRDQWVSFDDDDMIRLKSEYIKSMGLGGGMIWALDLDDFVGESCGCGQYPLLKVINSVLKGSPSPPKCNLESAPGPAVLPNPPVEDTIIPGDEKQDTGIVVVADGTLTDSENEIPWAGANGQACHGRAFAPSALDCNKYFICNQGSLLLLNCPPGLHWNEDHCDWPANAQCKEKIKRAQSHGRLISEEINDRRFICYFTSWASYRNGEGHYTPDDINANQCTHVVYAYADLDAETLKIVPHDTWTDVDQDFYGKVTSLRSKGIKVLIAIGGWNESSKNKFAKMAVNSTIRQRFVRSTLTFLNKWNFDGLEISWQYPVCPQGICEDGLANEKALFSDLLLDLSLALRSYGYLLSAVVAPYSDIIDSAYDVGILATTVDWVSVAAYDYYGYWDNYTNFAVPLYHNYDEPDDTINVNYTLHYWLSLGIPANKLVLGVPLYGQTYTLAEPAADIGIIELPVAGPGKPGNFTMVPGFLSFYEICSGIQKGQWEMARDMGGGAVAGRGDQWLSFPDSDLAWSSGALGRYLDLAGVAAWALDLDDFRNSCQCGRNVLLDSLHRGLNGLSMLEKKCP